VTGTDYWSQELTRPGDTVRIMTPAFVMAYLKSNKNDRHDAEAVFEAVERPSMLIVSDKSAEQQAMLQLYHGRRLLLCQRVVLSKPNDGEQVEPALAETGIVRVRETRNLDEKLARE